MEKKYTGKRVLVIEDEPSVSRVCVQTLSFDGFQVDVGENGLKGVKMVGLNTYDLIISDIRTPSMDGIQFYKYLYKNHPELANRVIFITGDILSPYVNSFLEAYRCPCLSKPFVPRELREIVKETLQDLPVVSEKKTRGIPQLTDVAILSPDSVSALSTGLAGVSGIDVE